jgi:stearoyl-CoA desaturase (delta-9 desaturase)
MTVKQLVTPWSYDAETLAKSPLKTPTDWIQRNVYDPYRHHGRWIGYIIPGLLFGPWGFVLAWAIDTIFEPWFSILIGNWAFHKIGFTYEKNKNKTVKSRTFFPIGFLLAGEELHANHHNYPNSINYRRRWFEFDIGYVYALILRRLGWAEFSEQAINKKKIS